MKPKIEFQLERRQIKAVDFQPLLDAFDAEAMTSQELARHYGTLTITLGGYPDRRESPFRVPELRIFLRELGQVWRPGAAAYFCDRHTPFFVLYLMSQLPAVVATECDRTHNYFIQCRQDELEAVIIDAALGFAQLGARAGMTSPTLKRRQKQLIREVVSIFKYRPKA
jgi:hypothetical protein